MTKENVIRWEAEEYVQHDKNGGWYVGLVFVGLVLVALAVVLRWWTFVLLVVVSVVTLFIYTLRPPRMLRYTLDEKGLTEGARRYDFVDYKSFGIMKDGEHFIVVLTPRKRFSGRVRVLFPEAQGEKIVDAFGAKLPMEEVRLDFIDKVVKFLRI